MSVSVSIHACMHVTYTHTRARAQETWRTINVRMDEEEEACMLSVWMNAYNTEADYGGNVFQTW